jgi:Flp pilus assembly protein TadG
MRARPRPPRGVFTIEFALVFPVLVLMLFGLIDVGRFIATRVMVSQAAAAGGRAACLGSATGPADVDQAVRDSATMLTGINVASMGCTGGCGWPRAAGAVVTVTVQYNFVSAFYKVFEKNMQNSSRFIC